MHQAKRAICAWALSWLILALMVPTTTKALLAQEAISQQVVIEIKDTTDADDYLCWSPVPARIKLAVPVPNPVTVKVSSVGQAEGGAVWFQVDNGIRPARETFLPANEISLSLPGDGTWVTFWIAGQRASSGSKDTNIVATDETGSELGTLPVMVRVRKNADRLSSIEINQFLEALAEVHDLDNQTTTSPFYSYSDAHRLAFNMGIHSGQPLFLAWHRAFLLNFERELQAVDARVALPYWRFDQPTQNIFTREFMGTVSGEVTQPGGFLVEFSQTNPIREWQMNGLNSFVRVSDGTEPPVAENGLDFLSDPFFEVYRAVNRQFELNYHNDAHRLTGGWLGQRYSPSDPLFFLLHANVDRAWAHWQGKFDRFNPTDETSYSHQGSYDPNAGDDRLRKGSYALDMMWPWSGIGGNQGTADAGDDWPVVSFLMPTVPGTEGPMLPPRPADMIDYLDIAGQGLAHGACYDDTDYYGLPISADN